MGLMVIGYMSFVEEVCDFEEGKVIGYNGTVFGREFRRQQHSFETFFLPKLRFSRKIHIKLIFDGSEAYFYIR